MSVLCVKEFGSTISNMHNYMFITGIMLKLVSNWSHIY